MQLMSYDVQLFRIEVKKNHQTAGKEDFFEDENNLVPFTPEQRQRLHDRLLNHGYVVSGSPASGTTEFVFKGGLGITVLLTERALYFQSSFNTNGIFEISQTASEFTDDDAFAKYDPQADGWEEF